MAAPVSGLAGAEVPPESPAVGAVGLVIGAFGGGAEPEVPLEPGGNRRPVLRDRGHAAVAADPGVTLSYRTDRAGANHLDDAVDVAVCVTLHAELRREPVLAREVGHLARFLDRVRHRLLAVEVLVEPERRHRRMEVGVVRRRYRDGIDVTVHLVEHLAEVVELPGAGVPLVRAARTRVVDIAHRDDGHVLHATQPVEVGPAPPSDTDDRYPERLVRRAGEELSVPSRDPYGVSADRSRPQHLPSADTTCHDFDFPFVLRALSCSTRSPSSRRVGQ